MSSQFYSYSSHTSYSTSSSSNGQRSGKTYQQTIHSDPSSTHVQTTSQKLGGPAIQDVRQYDSEGRPVLEGGRTLGARTREVGMIEDIEEIDDGNSGK
jgi:hypothetical protein